MRTIVEFCTFVARVSRPYLRAFLRQLTDTALLRSTHLKTSTEDAFAHARPKRI